MPPFRFNISRMTEVGRGVNIVLSNCCRVAVDLLSLLTYFFVSGFDSATGKRRVQANGEEMRSTTKYSGKAVTRHVSERARRNYLWPFLLFGI